MPSEPAKGNVVLIERIGAFHAASHGTYGTPCIRADLADADVHVGQKRAARLMRASSPVGVSRRRFVVTTTRDGVRLAPNLVDRTSTANALNML